MVSPDLSQEVDLRVIAGGLAALNTAMSSLNQMARFLCDRYIIDHFDYSSASFLEYATDKHSLLPPTSEFLLNRSFYLLQLSPDQLEKAVFEFIQLSQTTDNE